jgi:histone H3/H4
MRTLAGELLKGIGEPLWERGTAHEKTKRLQVQMRETGTKMVMIDEFQHFYDQDNQKMMYTVANWLKNLIKESKVALVVAGLPDCTALINQNEQLRRLFLNPVRLPRFSWRDPSSRREFRTILREFHKEMSKKYEMLPLHSEEMAFRVYCATGGLIGYVAKLLRQAERNAVTAKRKTISLEDLEAARLQAVYSCDVSEPRLLPFEKNFSLVVNATVLDQANKIGRPIEQAKLIRRRSITHKDESLDSLLRKR